MSIKSIKIEHLNDAQIQEMTIKTWPIWQKEPSTFDWFYDTTEKCLLLEGEVTVQTPEGNYEIKAGDFVTFSKGLKCTWIVKKAVRKHYNFE